MERINILRFLTPKSAVVYIEEDATVRQAYEKMKHHRFGDVPVLDSEGRYVGVLSEADILSTLMDNKDGDIRALEELPVRKCMHRDMGAVSNEAPIRSLLERVRERKFVPVMDDREVFIGLVTRKDVINYFITNFLDTEE